MVQQLQQSFFRWLQNSPSRISILGIGLVILVAFGSYLAVQTATENNVRQALLDQQMQRQVDTVDSLSERVSSDINSITLKMQLLATNPLLQDGNFASSEVTALLKQQYLELNKVATVEGFGIIDNNGKVANTGVDEQRQYIGTDVSDRDYLRGVREDMQPYVSESFIGLNGKRAFAVAVPIINRESGENMGTLRARFVVPDFFKPYQDDLHTSNIVAFDRSQVYISTTVPEFLGLSFWGDAVQTATGRSEKLNGAYGMLFSGKPASTLFISGVTHDERFVAAAPVFFAGEQVMSVAITMPTATIYAQVNDILFIQKIQIIVALVAVVSAISALILYFSKSNRALDERVKQRTDELQKANQKLETSNLLQKEFINIAAHELRTPIQPLLGLADLLGSGFVDGKDKIEITKPEVDMIVRNAKRLEQLSSDILVVARIDNNSLELHKEQVNLIEKITRVIEDLQSYISTKSVRLVFAPSERVMSEDGGIMVQADRSKLFEVLSNLIRNAVKFTDEGTITVTLDKKDDYAIVSVIDTGKGIDSEIMPRLFTKFATKSDAGTGLGLFISKNIVEAHGGKIWAENNPGGKGATFTFTLPIPAAPRQKDQTS